MKNTDKITILYQRLPHDDTSKPDGMYRKIVDSGKSSVFGLKSYYSSKSECEPVEVRTSTRTPWSIL